MTKLGDIWVTMTYRNPLVYLLSLVALPIYLVQAADESSTSTENIIILTGTKVSPTAGPTYPTLASSTILTGTEPSGNVTTASDSTVVYITGSVASSTAPGNSSTSSSATLAETPVATNTRPCNKYPEFCSRKYSNITEVGCHNSPFVRVGSAAANQEFPVTDQLNDGIRFLQAQVQWPINGSIPHLCHTSCDLLDAGPLLDWLVTVKDWVAAHPYDVVTILLGNGNYSTPDLYVPHILESGLRPYIFTPPVVPMTRDAWPTLEQMLLEGHRVVMFLDYMANQTTYPWLLDEFSHMWETPFDPVDQVFPCTVQRPPDLSAEDARKRLYLMNHNFNVQVTLLGNTLLVPAISALNVTNDVTGNGSVGLAASNCRSTYDFPPKVLNVDYYNYGGFPGSVFEAAARMNNVTYTRECCGPGASAAARVKAMMPVVSAGLVCLFVCLLV